MHKQVSQREEDGVSGAEAMGDILMNHEDGQIRLQTLQATGTQSNFSSVHPTRRVSPSRPQEPNPKKLQTPPQPSKPDSPEPQSQNRVSRQSGRTMSGK